MSANNDAETEPNPLDFEDVDGIRRLGEGANRALKDLVNSRRLTELTLGGQPISRLPEPRVAPMEVLQQLTPLSRTIRERSRVSGELVLKKDVAGGRREELFVPRAQLAQQFAKLPFEYRKPFEDMGVSSEDTQPAITLPTQLRPPARAVPPRLPARRRSRSIRHSTPRSSKKKRRTSISARSSHGATVIGRPVAIHVSWFGSLPRRVRRSIGREMSTSAT